MLSEFRKLEKKSVSVMERRKNELLEVDIYGNEDTIVETIGQRIRRIRISKGLT